MATVGDILELIETIAPPELAMSFDNCGLLVGDKNAVVTSCVLALDITNEVIAKAMQSKAQLIITHHPIIFNPLKTIKKDDLVFKLIQNNISVISAHTNLDIATGGVNDALCKALDIKNVTILENSDGIIRTGEIEKMTAIEFAEIVKKKLNAKGVVLTNSKKIIKTVGVASGAGGDYLHHAIKAKVDVFVTGEAKHNIFVDSINNDISLIVAGHHFTEVVVLKTIKEKLQKQYNEILFKIMDDFLIEQV